MLLCCCCAVAEQGSLQLLFTSVPQTLNNFTITLLNILQYPDQRLRKDALR